MECPHACHSPTGIHEESSHRRGIHRKKSERSFLPLHACSPAGMQAPRNCGGVEETTILLSGRSILSASLLFERLFKESL